MMMTMTTTTTTTLLLLPLAKPDPSWRVSSLLSRPSNSTAENTLDKVDCDSVPRDKAEPWPIAGLVYIATVWLLLLLLLSRLVEEEGRLLLVTAPSSWQSKEKRLSVASTKDSSRWRNRVSSYGNAFSRRYCCCEYLLLIIYILGT